MPVDLYAAHADTIEAAITHTCRARRLTGDAADEFSSWARIRLLDNGQAILHKFANRSSLRTFLITVVQRLFLDWRNAEWGKWRPTADARRLGPVAIELERLVIRDGLSYDEAVQTLGTRGVAAADTCDFCWGQLPRRPRRKMVADADLSAVAGGSSASDVVDDDEARAAATAVSDALARALADLEPGDRLIIQMRYWTGHTVARIAALTGEEPKGLYRRFERLATELRRRLEAEGLSGQVLDRLAGRFDAPPPEVPLTGTEMPVVGPSTHATTGGKHV